MQRRECSVKQSQGLQNYIYKSRNSKDYEQPTVPRREVWNKFSQRQQEETNPIDNLILDF